jgi:hypothetical protein
MQMSRWVLRGFGVAVVVLGLALGRSVSAQVAGATILAEPPVPLLGASMGGISRQGISDSGTDAADAYFLKPDDSQGGAPNRAYEAALVEDGLTRWGRASYDTGHGVQHFFAMQFRDATGAYAAWTMQQGAGAKIIKLKNAGAAQYAEPAMCAGLCPTIALANSVVLEFTGNDVADAQKIVADLPKVSGTAALPPLLPTFLPEKRRQDGSARYAVGPAGFVASGMQAALGGGSAIDPKSLGWEKYAEGASAVYSGAGGREQLLLLLYPTPEIAGAHALALRNSGAAVGTPQALQVRREGELVMAASGAWSAAETAAFLGGIHLRQEASFDKDMPASFHAEVGKTYSLLSGILVMVGVLGVAAVLMALFLGGGRAIVRRVRGQDAASDVEFLSLHLDPANPPARFHPQPADPRDV